MIIVVGTINFHVIGLEHVLSGDVKNCFLKIASGLLKRREAVHQRTNVTRQRMVSLIKVGLLKLLRVQEMGLYAKLLKIQKPSALIANAMTVNFHGVHGVNVQNSIQLKETAITIGR